MNLRVKTVMLSRHENRSEKSRYLFEGKDGNPRGYVYQGIIKVKGRAGVNDPNVIAEKDGKVTFTQRVGRW